MCLYQLVQDRLPRNQELRLSNVLAKLRPAVAAVHLTQTNMDTTPTVVCIQVVFSTKTNGRASRLETMAIGVSLTGETEKHRKKAENCWLAHLQRCGLCYREALSRPRICAEEMAEHRILNTLRTDLKNRTLDWITIAYRVRETLDWTRPRDLCHFCQHRMARILAENRKMRAIVQKNCSVRIWDAAPPSPNLLVSVPSVAGPSIMLPASKKFLEG
jgi:hypothetical protein